MSHFREGTMEPDRLPAPTATKTQEGGERAPTEDRDAAAASGSRLALPGLATQEPPMQAWLPTWGKEIDDYIDELDTKTLKKLKKTYAGLGPALEELRKKLKNPAITASACRSELEAVRAVCRKADAHEAASSFPTNTENNLIEYVNAKLLWERGDTSLTPGTTVKTKNKKGQTADMKPDYDAGGIIGDCVRIKKPAAPATALIDNIGADVTDKLTTYPELNVRVVIDMTGSGGGAEALKADLADTKTKIIQRLKTIENSIISRMPRVDVVLPGDVVVRIDQAELR
jgi:hypothetical protein